MSLFIALMQVKYWKFKFLIGWSQVKVFVELSMKYSLRILFLKLSIEYISNARLCIFVSSWNSFGKWKIVERIVFFTQISGL